MKTLLVVDAQKDFMPGGSLAVPEGDLIVPYINNIRNNYNMIFWTKDWHPKNHSSFKEFGGVWPTHCVQMSRGSELHDRLVIGSGQHIIFKGTDQEHDSYSAFVDANGKTTGLHTLMNKYNIIKFDVVGLATEYCVKFTVLDAIRFGFKPTVLTSGIRGINPQDTKKALKEMESSGAIIK